MHSPFQSKYDVLIGIIPKIQKTKSIIFYCFTFLPDTLHMRPKYEFTEIQTVKLHIISTFYGITQKTEPILDEKKTILYTHFL